VLDPAAVHAQGPVKIGLVRLVGEPLHDRHAHARNADALGVSEGEGE
jgi:hypothetical protein